MQCCIVLKALDKIMLNSLQLVRACLFTNAIKQVHMQFVLMLFVLLHSHGILSSVARHHSHQTSSWKVSSSSEEMLS